MRGVGSEISFLGTIENVEVGAKKIDKRNGNVNFLSLKKKMCV